MIVAGYLHSSVTKSYKYGILNAMCKSRVGVRLGKLQIMRRTSFCELRYFKSFLSAANSHAEQVYVSTDLIITL